MTAIRSALIVVVGFVDDVEAAPREVAELFRMGEGLNWAARTGLE